MRRLHVYLQREGLTKTLFYSVVVIALLYQYVKLWSIPGGRSFVLSVLILGLSLGTAAAQVMYRNIDRSTIILWITGLSLWGCFVFLQLFQVPLPYAAYWGLNTLFWMQLAAVFLVVSYEPD